MNSKIKKLPYVSIIVPLYNDEARISNCIASLINQSYLSENYEIIVVDNNSTDNSVAEVKKYPVKIFYEKDIQSSYAARNRGIVGASGDIFAFTDSDCTPVHDWIAEGVKALQDNNADLASGNVRFIFSLKRTGAEIYDSLTNMQIEQNIFDRKVSKTANLFVRAGIFDSIGEFPTVRSGGDVLWTGKATKKGFKLVYNYRAEVAHPARNLLALMKKQYRVGKGQPAIMKISDNSILKNIWIITKLILPTRLMSTFRMVKRRLPGANSTMALKASIAAYLCCISNFYGNLAVFPDLWRK